MPVSATAAHVYTEGARIWNPIHTDAAVAARAGLPGIILHGTATLALAVSISVTCVVLWGVILGSMLPFVMRAFNVDPASSSTPFVATIVDVTGLLLYFGVAIAIIGL